MSDSPTPGISGRSLPPILGRLLSGTFWLALRTPLQAVTGFWSVPLIIGAFGDGPSGAYRFAWGLGFFQFLLEFGMSSALQREISERWTRGDRDGVDRAITCGALFYAVIALVQAVVLMAVAYGAIPHARFSGPDEYRLIVQLLWLQALTAPFYGISVVVSCILQAARRYEVMPRFELLIVAIRFVALLGGVAIGAGLLTIVITQTVLTIGLSLGPAVWVIGRELDYRPRFVRVGFDDFRNLVQFSVYMFLVQLSVVLADKIDTTVLGFALDDAAKAETVYWAVSSPFLQLRQMGWTLAYFVMPAVASLAAVGDREGLERVTYDGARMHSAAVLLVGLLAFVYAGPFLELWVGGRFPGQVPELVRLMRLFLVAALPLFVAVHVQAATGLGRLRLIAVAALIGGVINLPLSYALTLRLGVSGVIWGTVLTTLVSNLLVPAIYSFRVLGVRFGTYLRRTLLAPSVGAMALLGACWLLGAVAISAEPRGDDLLGRLFPFALHLGVGSLAFAAGYVLVPVGRKDVTRILDRIRARLAAS
ncbi:polysaccharide biosynthesis protein [Tautonia sociabilis]|uniref:Polysaccharide biosynthesis protein n=1 Tax=Tautonia sociabilis TaxID=2080755 RepID=A0A432MPK9_9BACT|nr:polysaccharide biosynthesis protein [Tautonia sociabilis]